QLKHACSFPGTVPTQAGERKPWQVLRCLVSQFAILAGKKEQRFQVRILAQGRLLYFTHEQRMIPHIETRPDFTVDVGQTFIEHWAARRLGEVWDLGKLVAFLRGFASPPG